MENFEKNPNSQVNFEIPNFSKSSVVFLSSSFVNLGKLFAEISPEYDVFLIFDRKFPHEYEDLDNFYTYTFDKIGTWGYHCHLHSTMTGTITVI